MGIDWKWKKEFYWVDNKYFDNFHSWSGYRYYFQITIRCRTISTLLQIDTWKQLQLQWGYRKTPRNAFETLLSLQNYNMTLVQIKCLSSLLILKPSSQWEVCYGFRGKINWASSIFKLLAADWSEIRKIFTKRSRYCNFHCKVKLFSWIEFQKWKSKSGIL